MLSRIVAYRRQQANGDRWSSHVEKGIVMSLIVMVTGAEGNAAEAGVFCCVVWNVKFQVLDLEAGLGEGLRDTGEGEGERLEVGSHGEDYNPCQFLYSLSTAKALPRFDSDFQVCLASEYPFQ